MFFRQDIVVGFFFEELFSGGPDKADGGIGFVFGKNQNADGNGGAVEEIGRQSDDGFHIVVVHQVPADFLLGSAPVEDAGKADEHRSPRSGEIAEGVEHKGKVCLGFGSENAGGGKAVVIDEGGVIGADPFNGVRRVGDNGVKGFVLLKVRV